MKRLFIFISLFGLMIHASQAQFITELELLDDNWNMELFNYKSINIQSLKIIIRNDYDFRDTIIVPQWAIDSLKITNKFVVLKSTDLKHSLRFYPAMTITAKINDTIESSLRLSCTNTKLGESIIYLDSIAIHKNNYLTTIPRSNFPQLYETYIGRGSSSLGKANKRDDAFAVVKGKITASLDIRNTIFEMEDAWDYENGSSSISVDSLGNFVLATWPAHCSNRINHLNIYIKDHPEVQWNSLNEEYLNPGINYKNIVAFAMGIEELKNATKLLVSPNPIKERLTVSYTIPSEFNYHICTIQISNAQGQTLQTVALENAEGSQVIELDKTVSNGTYFCSLVSKGVVYKTVQFMVQR